jgi:1-acyl-sn-glycerol-3-phosphate acyltransferase
MGLFSFIYNIYVILVVGFLIIIFSIIGCFLGLFKKNIWHKLTFLLSKIIRIFLFLGTDVLGKENIPKGNCIIASNQLSHLDGLIIRGVVNKNIFAITEPFKKFHPLFVFWMKRLSFVDLRRTKEEDKKYKESHSRKQGMEIAEKQIKSGMSLMVFPEGHFERKKKLLHFYPGAVKLALATGVSILPVSIQGTEKVWPADHMFRRPARIKVQFGKPITIKVVKKPSEKLIKQKTIQLKKEVARMLPRSFLKRGWEKNAKE